MQTWSNELDCEDSDVIVKFGEHVPFCSCNFHLQEYQLCESIREQLLQFDEWRSSLAVAEVAVVWWYLQFEISNSYMPVADLEI